MKIVFHSILVQIITSNILFFILESKFWRLKFKKFPKIIGRLKIANLCHTYFCILKDQLKGTKRKNFLQIYSNDMKAIMLLISQ